MNPVDEIMNTAGALTLRMKRFVDKGVASPHDLADCLHEAVVLRTEAAKVAMGLPAGSDRDFVVAVRAKTIEGEQKLRRGLGLPSPVYGSGRG